MGALFESIKRGLEEAIAHSKGEHNEVRLFTPDLAVSSVLNPAEE